MDSNLPLPSERMPDCWNDGERMSALFSPFRSKSANPQDWASKYKFWQNLIYEWLRYTMRSSFSIEDLNSTFKRRGCTPLCLITVVEELYRNNEIIPENEFLKDPCDSWASWSVDLFVKRPLSWSFLKVKSYIVNNEVNKETRYIHLQIIKELGNTLFAILEERKENILIPFSEILKDCQCKIDKNISDDTVMLILIWLRRERKITFRNSETENELLIKIVVQSSDSITELDEGLYKLIKQENELVKEIEHMEKEKINIINETRSYLTKGLRQVAKTHLRKKKKLEDTIEKRAQTLENIQNLISNIQNTHTNTAVLSAYKAGSNVLKELNKSCLSESYVRDIMDDLSEALEEQKEVEFILSETIQSDDSNTDFEQELAELIELDKNILPSAPDDDLSSINELEDKLNNLHVEDTTVTNTPSKSSKNKENKRTLANLECT